MESNLWSKWSPERYTERKCTERKHTAIRCTERKCTARTGVS